jgi:hypothetical protein
MFLNIINLVIMSAIGTIILYAALPNSRKEWSLLPLLFMGVLIYIAVTGGIAFGTWVMISAFVGSGVGPAIIIGLVWLLAAFFVAKSWLN